MNVMRSYAERKSEALKAKNTQMITYDELERIRSMVSDKTEEQEYKTMVQSKRQALHNVSQSKVAKWPNTSAAERERKEYERIKKLEDEEIARRQVDAEEEAYQQKLRQQQLDKANQMFHNSQDMVKGLHSKMLMADVFAERDVQEETKAKKAALQKQIALQWEELEKQKMAEYDERLRAKLEKEYNKKQANAKMVQDQLEDFKMTFIKRLQDDEDEGQRIKAGVEEELEREKLRALEARKKAAGQREEFKKANEELLKLQAQIALKEKEEERRIDEYAKKREAMEYLRKTKEEERFKNKQAVRQALIDRQIGELMKVRDLQEQQLNKQVAEAEQKAAEAFEEKEKRRAEMKQAIEKSRKNQMDRLAKQKADGRAEEKEFAEFWKLRNEELAIAEQQEREEERQRRVELTNYLKKQADEKNMKAQEEFVNSQHEALHNQALMDQQEKNFYSYAEKCIGEWQGQGKNVKPLILELKNYKKKVA